MVVIFFGSRPLFSVAVRALAACSVEFRLAESFALPKGVLSRAPRLLEWCGYLHPEKSLAPQQFHSCGRSEAYMDTWFLSHCLLLRTYCFAPTTPPVLGQTSGWSSRDTTILCAPARLAPDTKNLRVYRPISCCQISGLLI